MGTMQGSGNGSENGSGSATSADQQKLVEVALGYRLVPNGTGHQVISLTTTRRAVVEGSDPKPVVRPATSLEWRMWQLLISGESEWTVCDPEGAGW